MVMYTDSDVLYTEHNEATLQLIDRFGARFKMVDNYRNVANEIIELVYVGENRQSLHEIKKHFSFPFSFGIKLTYSKSQSHFQYYLEVKKAEVSKATALKILLKKLGISIRDTVVVGDWYNDVALFKTKAIKVSLSNAVPEIKFLSDVKLEKSNNEDGVGELLERIYSQKV
jgi:HAD superfamily hydrolase (TIGR01484 family)